MPLPFSVAFENYRSFEGKVHIPFTKKVTIVAGPNNTGKSNILRALAILLNKDSKALDENYDFDGGDKTLRADLTFTDDFVVSCLRDYRYALEHYKQRKYPLIGTVSVSKRDVAFSIDIDRISPHLRDYLNASHMVLADFGSSSGSNIGHLASRVDPRGMFLGTSYVPNIRFITEVGMEPPQFTKHNFPGEVISFGTVIDELAELDRPSDRISQRREQFQKLQDFMAYALDVSSVRVQVPNNRSTILVSVAGDERRLGNLGTGVEQLLIIGLASVAFPGKMVLIDEPELHLHPTSQRRLLTYLERNVEADFVIATHSASVMDAVEADIIHISRSEDGKKLTRSISSSHERHLAVRDLGHMPSDLVQTRFAIWVEGPSDRVYLNFWISTVDPELVEGVDYTILFYGGSILAQHAFTDDTSELVKALSLSRSFAVVIDSDRRPDKPRLRRTKIRVQKEVEEAGGMCWITDGREIENYVSPEVISKLALRYPWVAVPVEKTDQILNPTQANKTKFARDAIASFDEIWPYDLKHQVRKMVECIRNAGPNS